MFGDKRTYDNGVFLGHKMQFKSAKQDNNQS